MAVFYRLYYDSDGMPITYCMQDLPGTYLEIDVQTFAEQRYDIRIINGRIVRLHELDTARLYESDSGTACDPDDISIVVTEGPRKLWTYTHLSK